VGLQLTDDEIDALLKEVKQMKLMHYLRRSSKYRGISTKKSA